MARAIILAARAGDIVTCTSREIISTGSAFAPGKALNFGSRDYDADHSGELHFFNETSSKDNESPAPYPPISLLRTDLEVLFRQIHTMLDMVTNPGHLLSDS
jgi:hypothetical protein